MLARFWPRSMYALQCEFCLRCENVEVYAINPGLKNTVVGIAKMDMKETTDR